MEPVEISVKDLLEHFTIPPPEFNVSQAEWSAFWFRMDKVYNNRRNPDCEFFTFTCGSFYAFLTLFSCFFVGLIWPFVVFTVGLIIVAITAAFVVKNRHRVLEQALTFVCYDFSRNQDMLHVAVEFRLLTENEYPSIPGLDVEQGEGSSSSASLRESPSADSLDSAGEESERSRETYKTEALSESELTPEPPLPQSVPVLIFTKRKRKSDVGLHNEEKKGKSDVSVSGSPVEP